MEKGGCVNLDLREVRRPWALGRGAVKWVCPAVKEIGSGKENSMLGESPGRKDCLGKKKGRVTALQGGGITQAETELRVQGHFEGEGGVSE